MNRLKQWLRQREQRRRDVIWRDAVQQGYGWAWTAWRIEGKSTLEIDSYIGIGFDESLRSKGFDHGAEMALADITDFCRQTGAAPKPENT